MLHWNFWNQPVEAENREEFVRVLTGIATIKRVDLTKEAFDLWWNSMQGWDIGDFKDAAGYLLKNCQFMPSPYDFEELLKKQRPSAHEAWADALCFAGGGWRTGLHDDDRINCVVSALGGWSVIALCDLEKLGFLERRFIETYNDFIDGDDVRQALPNLTEQPARIGAPVSVGQLIKQATG